MIVHVSWESPFDTKSARDLGIAVYELLPYCFGLEGDSEGVVLQCSEIPKEELDELKRRLKYVEVWTEEGGEEE